MEAKENKKICFRTLLTFKKWKNKRSYLRRLQWHGGEGDLCCPGERCTRSRQPQWWCGIRSWPWRISCWHVHRLSPAEHKKRQRPIRYYTQVGSPTMRLRLARCTARVKRWSEAMDFLQNKYLLIAHLWELYYKGLDIPAITCCINFSARKVTKKCAKWACIKISYWPKSCYTLHQL